MKLAEHPTVRHFHETQRRTSGPAEPPTLDAAWLRQLCLDCGADDAGLVEIGRPALDDQRDDILRFFPPRQDAAQLRLPDEPGADPQPGPVGRQPGIPPHRRSRQRGRPQGRRRPGASGRPGGEPGDGLPDGDGPLSGRQDLGRLAQAGRRRGGAGADGHPPQRHPPQVRQLHPAGHGADRRRGDRLRSAASTTTPAWNASCAWRRVPVGAISPDGDFNFSACYTHNYREFMGGFTDWVEKIADSKNALDYRRKVSDPESASMWQSLSFGPNYKAAYCLAVCPAGEDVIGPFLTDKAELSARTSSVRSRRRRRRSTSSPARMPRTTSPAVSRTRRSSGSATACGPARSQTFLCGLRLTFQPGKATGLNAVYHFTFTGKEQKQATVTIRDGTLAGPGRHQGKADLRVTADSETWLGFLAKERSLLWALLRRRIRIKGSPRLLVAFGKCFPS